MDQLWELKLLQSGAIQEASSHEAPVHPVAKPPVPQSVPVAAPVHDLNEPYVATEEYEAPSTDMAFSRVWLFLNQTVALTGLYMTFRDVITFEPPHSGMLY